MCFHICFPRKGTLTLTPGMGLGGFRTQNPQQQKTKITKNHPSYENCSQFWNSVPKMFKNTLKRSSYIQQLTLNPIKSIKNSNS